jgi:hypothetical protein
MKIFIIIALQIAMLVFDVTNASAKEMSIKISREENTIVARISNDSQKPCEIISPTYGFRIEIWDGDLGFRAYPLSYLEIIDKGGFVPIERIHFAAGESKVFKIHLKDFSSLNAEARSGFLQRLEKAKKMRSNFKLVVKIDTFKSGSDTPLPIVSDELLVGAGQSP